jgi:hypothetical protein
MDHFDKKQEPHQCSNGFRKKRSCKIGASWSAADFKISDGIESGPVALCMFCFFSSLVTPLQKEHNTKSALTTKKIPKKIGHLSRARVKNGLELKNKMGFLQSDNKSKAEILNEQFQGLSVNYVTVNLTLIQGKYLRKKSICFF